MNLSNLNEILAYAPAVKLSQKLDDLTIIVPTYERQHLLVRLMILLFSYDLRVIVVDGSTSPLDASILKDFFGHGKIEYHHSDLSYADRICWASKRVSTPYAMCFADDDLCLYDGLIETLEKLETHDSAVACMGQGMGFDTFMRNPYAFSYAESLKGYSIQGDEPKSRIIRGMFDYRTATPYAIFRTDAFREIWRAREPVSCLEAAEYEHAAYTYLLGDLITSERTYWLRSFEEDPVDSVKDGSRTLTFDRWINSEKHKVEVSHFEKRLRKRFESIGGFNAKESKEIYDYINKAILSKSHVGLMSDGKLLGFASSVLAELLQMDSKFIQKIWKSKLFGTMKRLAHFLGRKRLHARTGMRSGELQPVSNLLNFAKKYDFAISKKV